MIYHINVNVSNLFKFPAFGYVISFYLLEDSTISPPTFVADRTNRSTQNSCGTLILLELYFLFFPFCLNQGKIKVFIFK